MDLDREWTTEETVNYIMRSMKTDDDTEIKKYKNNIQILNYITSYRWTLLNDAVCAQYEKCIRTLVDCGADINIQSKNGNTCLHYAVILGHPHIIKLLLELGSKPTIKNNDGDDVLAASDHYISTEIYTIVKSMLEEHNNKNASKTV